MARIFWFPVDAAISREADVPLEAMRMGDLMSMLETVRAKTRIVILDACRDNPFADISRSAPRGLAMVNAPAGTLLAYSTSPGQTAEDGSARNSPFAQALIKSARQPGLPIETALKNVRLSVHGATGGRQTPWEVSALTEPFAFFPGNAPVPPGRDADKTADQWRKDLQTRSARDAFAIAIKEDNIIVYEQYIALYGNDPLATNLRSLLDRRLMMLAWQEAVALNSEAAFASFLARYPNSDLSATARRLQQRAQNRMADSVGPGRCARCKPDPRRQHAGRYVPVLAARIAKSAGQSWRDTSRHARLYSRRAGCTGWPRRRAGPGAKRSGLCPDRSRHRPDHPAAHQGSDPHSRAAPAGALSRSRQAWNRQERSHQAR